MLFCSASLIYTGDFFLVNFQPLDLDNRMYADDIYIHICFFFPKSLGNTTQLFAIHGNTMELIALLRVE